MTQIQHIKTINPKSQINLITIDRTIRTELREKKYALISAEEFSISSELTADRQHLFSDWNNLKMDNYLKDGARFRQRRFGLFYFLPSTGELRLLKSAPYIQSRKINAYAGGIPRKLAPLLDATQTNQFLHNLIKFNFQQFPLDNNMTLLPWEIDVHQFGLWPLKMNKVSQPQRAFTVMGMISIVPT